MAANHIKLVSLMNQSISTERKHLAFMDYAETAEKCFLSGQIRPFCSSSNFLLPLPVIAPQNTAIFGNHLWWNKYSNIRSVEATDSQT